MMNDTNNQQAETKNVWRFDPVDITQMGLDPAITLAERLIDREAIALGLPTADFWSAVKQAARQEADRLAD